MGRLLMLLSVEAAAVMLAWDRASALRRALPPGRIWWQDLGAVLLVAAHLAALLVATWVLLGTLHDLGVAAGLARGRRSARHRLAPRWVQATVNRAVSSAVVVAVLAGPTVGPAAAQDRGPDVALQVVRPPVPPRTLDPVAPTPPAPAPASNPVPPAQTPGPTPDPGPTLDPTPDPGGGTRVVAPGENLWVIARSVLLARGTPSDREVHAYWVRLLAANDTTIRSGDPDLVQPGEVLTLPPVDVVSAEAA